QTLELAEEPTITWLNAEQSNTSWIVDDRIMLKQVRRITGGQHPEAEMTRYLTAAGYTNTPRLLGEVVRHDAQNTPHTLMLLQSYIGNQGDAWTWTLNYLRQTLDNA